jgi:hypothetical protein
MKKAVNIKSRLEGEKSHEETQVIETEASPQQLHAFLDNLCAEPEFALLRETLRLYRDEVRVH